MWIKKCAIKKGDIAVVGIDGKGTSLEREVTLRSYQKAHPDLYESLAALVPHVRDILMLEGGTWERMITPIGVSWSQSEDGVEGAVITSIVSIETANSPLVINTPHLPYEQYSSTVNPR